MIPELAKTFGNHSASHMPSDTTIRRGEKGAYYASLRRTTTVLVVLILLDLHKDFLGANVELLAPRLIPLSPAPIQSADSSTGQWTVEASKIAAQAKRDRQI